MDSISRFLGLGPKDSPPQPNLALLDFFFPGFSSISSAVSKTLGIDLNIYIPLILLFGSTTFVWRYLSDYVWGLITEYLMSTVEIRVDDEIYNMVMAWVSTQRFAQSSRRFVVKTNLNSRYSWLWSDEDEEEEPPEDDLSDDRKMEKEKKSLAYTPSFGSHTFWYRRRFLLFNRSQNREAGGFMTVSEREEISISCFGRSPWILKELLLEARVAYMKKDERKTLIYRASSRSAGSEPTWQRCLSRVSRPLSTVILDEKVKKDIVTDLTDYLNPSTRRWYANRGIPWRRGILLYGKPGTGKSSLSVALAGEFNMRIYMVSLSSLNATEDNLASLFSELPRRCMVLLEDIDTAGLTHTREEAQAQPGNNTPPLGRLPSDNGINNNGNGGRLSLSGLLNVLDGVASQEGRVLIMTTNHLEKLDKALIRPGRVDMVVKFTLVDNGMSQAIFRAIYATLDADAPKKASPAAMSAEEIDAEKLAQSKAKAEEEARVDRLAKEFASRMPEHEFSPAEVQGLLLKYKKEPEGAVAATEEWVAKTRRERREKEAQAVEDEKKKREEEEKTKKDEEKKQDEEKKKQEEEKKKEEEEHAAKEQAGSDKKNKKRRTRKLDKATREADKTTTSPASATISKGERSNPVIEDLSDSTSASDSCSDSSGSDTSVSEPDVQADQVTDGKDAVPKVATNSGGRRLVEVST